MNKSIKRLVALMLAVILCMSALAGCGGSNNSADNGGKTNNSAENSSTENKSDDSTTSEPSKEEEKKEDVVITMASGVVWGDHRPYCDGVIITRCVTGLYFDRLFHGYSNGEFYPRGADSWEISEDQHSVTFHLNKNATWHDGEPVTAYDYEFAAQVITTPGNPATLLFGTHYGTLVGVGSDYYADGTGLGVEVIDEYTIKYTYKNNFIPEVEMISNVYNYIALPKHLLEGEDPVKYMEWEFWNDPVGNGPLMIESETTGTEMVLVPYENYHLGAPKFDKLILKYLTNTSNASALMAGDIDCIVGSMVAEDVELLNTTDHVKVYKMAYPTYLRSLFINNVLVNDARVRRALDMSVDREAICAALGDNVIPISTPIIPTDKYYDETAGVRYDPEQAKELLAEAAADGAFDPNETLTIFMSPGVVGETIGNMVMQDWSALGLNVELQLGELSANLAAMKADEAKFCILNRMYSANPTGMCYANGKGYLRMNKDIWSELKTEYLQAPSAEAREEIIDRFQHMWLEEAPSVLIAGAYEIFAYNEILGDGESIGMECSELGSLPVWQWNVKQ